MPSLRGSGRTISIIILCTGLLGVLWDKMEKLDVLGFLEQGKG